MLAKELEILKQIEELYHGDTSEQEIIDFARNNQDKVKSWKDAFVEYPLFEISKAINHYYMKKSSKIRPNVAQIKAILQESSAEKEPSYIRSESENIKPSFWAEFLEQDRQTGDMCWLAPHYNEVGKLIMQNEFPFVQDINHPSYEDFRECMKRWSFKKFGRPYFYESDNQFNALSEEEQQKKYENAKEIMKYFQLQRM